MTVLERPASSRRRGLVVTVVVSLLAGVALGVGLLLGIRPALPLAAAPVGPALDLHAVDWAEATLPGSVCQSPAPIRLHAGEASAVPSSFSGPTPNYPQDVHVDVSAAVYGDLTGDGHDEVALPLSCNNHDSTAAGTTVVTVVVFDGSSGQATLLGALTSSQPRLGDIPNAITVRQLLPGRVIGDESFYGPQDADCCPSGRAGTTWPWTGTALGAPLATITQPAATTDRSAAPTGTDPTSATSTEGVDAEALAMTAARATPQLDQSRVVTTRCASKLITVNGTVIGCGVSDRAGRRVAMVEVELVDLATRDTATYVAVPGSGCPGLPGWAAKNIGDMEGNNPC